MVRDTGTPSRLRDDIISRTGTFRKTTFGHLASSDRADMFSPGRRAKHDGIAMCLLRKDFEHSLPLRREHQVARNRRLLVLVWCFVVCWWLLGWFFF